MANKPIIQNSTLTDANGVTALSVATGGAVTLGPSGGSQLHIFKGSIALHNTSNAVAFIINPNSSTGWYAAGAIMQDAVGTYPLKWNSGTGVVSYTSSARQHKDDIEEILYGLSEVLLLKPSKYTRKSTQEKELGFIADEVITVIPEAAPLGKASFFGLEGDELIPAGVHYEMLTPVLVKAIQELSAKHDALEARLAALEAK